MIWVVIHPCSRLRNFVYKRMANPQKENGFTAIANEILEQLVKTPLLGAEFQVLLHIIRKTYGYNKKQDRISFTQFEKATGISRQTINKTIKNLIIKGMIVKIYLPDGNIGYTFIKDHEKWVVKTHLLVKGRWVTSQDVLTKTGKDVLTHKRKKENITKDIAEQALPVWNLEDKLQEMEEVENSYLDVIATFIREKPVVVENAKQLSAIISRYCRIAKKLSGAYTNKQIFDTVKRIQADNQEKRRKGNEQIEWSIDTIYKYLTK